MKLSKRLQYSYDLVKNKFYIFDPILDLIYQYESTWRDKIILEDILSDYDTEKTQHLHFISLDELITNIIDNPQIMPLIGYDYEIWGRYQQDDLILNSYNITYKDKTYTLQSNEYSSCTPDEIIDLEWPTELIKRLDDIYRNEEKNDT